MADVKKINFDNGDEYDIKDEEARNQIQELNETLTELTNPQLYRFQAAEGYELTSDFIYKIGRIAIFSIQVSYIGNTGSQVVATVPDDVKPARVTYFAFGRSGGSNSGAEYAYVSTNQNFIVNTGYAYNQILIGGAYITNS